MNHVIFFFLFPYFCHFLFDAVRVLLKINCAIVFFLKCVLSWSVIELFIPACKTHFYGINCTQKCGTDCVNKTCNHVTGECDIYIQVSYRNIQWFIKKVYKLSSPINIWYGLHGSWKLECIDLVFCFKQHNLRRLAPEIQVMSFIWNR